MSVKWTKRNEPFFPIQTHSHHFFSLFLCVLHPGHYPPIERTWERERQSDRECGHILVSNEKFFQSMKGNFIKTWWILESKSKLMRDFILCVCVYVCVYLKATKTGHIHSCKWENVSSCKSITILFCRVNFQKREEKKKHNKPTTA